MTFVIDAHLPYRVARWLREAGHTAFHTDDLPDREQTSDRDIIQFAVANNAAVISKDSDFVDAFYLRGEPPKLLLISTGNIRNRALEQLVRQNLDRIITLFDEYSFVELSLTGLFVHE